MKRPLISIFTLCVCLWACFTIKENPVEEPEVMAIVQKEPETAAETQPVETGAEEEKPFITVWSTSSTDEEGSITGIDQIKLPLHPSGQYDFSVDWGDGRTDRIVSCDQQEAVHTYAIPGRYEVTITGTCAGFGFWYPAAGRSECDNTKLIEIKQWGNAELHNSGFQFVYARNLEKMSALDNPHLGALTDLQYMFAYTLKFNDPIGDWDTATIENMEGMFFSASSFNQDLAGWNTANVKNMKGMFFDADSFNGDISAWDTSNVTDMSHMFHQNDAFNRDISAWDVSSVTNMERMFSGCPLENSEPEWYLEFTE